MGESKYVPPSPVAAVAMGHAMVTLPTLATIGLSSVITVPLMGLVTATHALGFGVGVACLVGWLCWAFMMPRWRDWVVDGGVDPDRVQRLAVLTGLLWPRGSFIERTEFPRRNGKRGW